MKEIEVEDIEEEGDLAESPERFRQGTCVDDIKAGQDDDGWSKCHQGVCQRRGILLTVEE